VLRVGKIGGNAMNAMEEQAWIDEVQLIVSTYVNDLNDDHLGEMMLDHSEGYWNASYEAGLTPKQAMDELLGLLEANPDVMKDFRAERAPPIETELWPTGHFAITYEELALPCRIRNGRLYINLIFDEFEWEEGDGDDAENGEPHAIIAISTNGDRLDITSICPAAKELLRLGLVEKEEKEGL
jgi:hypothetical protein